MENVDIVTNKGVPKRDGSGAGRRLNRGRGGCEPTQDKNARGFGAIGRGMGPCGRGFGRGRGRCFGQGFGRGFVQQDEKAFLEQELEAIKKRLAELKD